MHLNLKKIGSRPLVLAISLNLVLFLAFLLLIKPIYDTEEDVFILYLLSGGFGSRATDLLHYNHILHPFFGFFLKSLFVGHQQINWYTLMLIAFHYTGCTIVLYQLLKLKSAIRVVVPYMVLFTVFECKFLTTVNFSNTAVLLGCAGLLLLFIASKDEENRSKKYASGILVLLAASMIRIHVLIPVTLVCVPFILLNETRKSVIEFFFALLATAALVFALNQFQQHYYESNLRGWQKEEKYRHTVYQFYNHNNLANASNGRKWQIESSLVHNGLPIDTSFLSIEKLKQMYRELQKKGANEPKTSERWFWINNRVFIFCVFFFLTFSYSQKKLTVAAVLSLTFISITFILMLSMFSKLPEYVLLSCLLFWCVLVILYSRKLELFHNPLSMTIAFLFMGWGCIRVYKMNSNNKEDISYFRSAFQEVARNQKSVFIVTGDAFPLQKFYVWDLPINYPLPNLLCSDHFLNNLYQQTYVRFNIKQTKEMPFSSNVLFWGPRIAALEEYFSIVNHRRVFASLPSKDFKYGTVYKIIPGKD